MKANIDDTDRNADDIDTCDDMPPLPQTLPPPSPQSPLIAKFLAKPRQSADCRRNTSCREYIDGKTQETM